MAWPLPDPVVLAERAAADLDATFGAEAIDPRAPESVFGAICRIVAMALFEEHLHLRAQADELMPDTAIENLERHADVWGVTRLPAIAAGGLVTFQGAAATPIPAGTELRTATGTSVLTEALATVGSGGTVDVRVNAAFVGAAGTLAAGTVLALVNPIAGLTVQGATVTSAGLRDPRGADLESDEALRARLLARIRTPPRGGAAADYEAWARLTPNVERVAVVPNWVGAGSVGVVIAMAGAAVPDGGTLAAIAATIAPLRPVTAEVHVVPVVRVPINLTIYLTPDNAATRAAITAASDLYFATVSIGEDVYFSRLTEAISSAGGEYAHAIVGVEDGRIAIDHDEIAVRGTFTWGGTVETLP
jgi:uncharacterized phage protein gp47/JayE